MHVKNVTHSVDLFLLDDPRWKQLKGHFEGGLWQLIRQMGLCKQCTLLKIPVGNTRGLLRRGLLKKANDIIVNIPG